MSLRRLSRRFDLFQAAKAPLLTFCGRWKKWAGGTDKCPRSQRATESPPTDWSPKGRLSWREHTKRVAAS